MIGGDKTLPLITLSPSELDVLLRTARDNKVSAMRLPTSYGEFTVQFEPQDSGSPAADPDPKTAGLWKRGPEIDNPPDWD